jgi:hypothetical protein
MAVAPLCDSSAASYRFRQVNGGPVMWCGCWFWCYERRLIPSPLDSACYIHGSTGYTFARMAIATP